MADELVGQPCESAAPSGARSTVRALSRTHSPPKQQNPQPAISADCGSYSANLWAILGSNSDLLGVNVDAAAR